MMVDIRRCDQKCPHDTRSPLFDRHAYAQYGAKAVGNKDNGPVAGLHGMLQALHPVRIMGMCPVVLLHPPHRYPMHAEKQFPL